MTSPLTLISPNGNHTRSLSDETIEKCMFAANEKSLDSLWSRVKDYFLGTHKSDVKHAIYTLANATEFSDQAKAFNVVVSCIDPGDLHRVSWMLDANKVVGFQIGENHFPATSDTQDFMKDVMPLNLDAMCRLLRTIRVGEFQALATPEHFGLNIDQVTSSPKSDEFLYEMQARDAEMRGLPALRDTLQVIGLHRETPEDVADKLKEQFSQSRPVLFGGRMMANVVNLVRLTRAMSDRH
ncbi:hypothetical protein UC34_17420 [Pandoraea vervacti]|uniref:Uncharacterized protein n=1 Tax=Pandoraea vervacti TaxID=656178 RepID=A0ABN4FSS2_9BURK|nr:hypothetical protein [Pandoraea vervacti]AJP58269.1 hypothetical protein UC34_17420 [Pandoraea vervacti]